jgi:ribosomal peptide maturation radical SAM protein 1
MSATEKPKVLLLSLPWTSLVEPSLGLGILKAVLDGNRIESRVSHLNLFLLKYMRATTYVSIANSFALNEFLFTHCFEETLSPEQLSELSLRVDEALSNRTFGNDERYKDRESIARLFLTLRSRIIPDYIMDCVKSIESYGPTMVGFTCMFDQAIASAAIAKVLKERNPDLFVVLGGYALEGDPGRQIIESFGFIDCVAYGEGEHVIHALALASTDRTLLENIPDILYRKEPNGEVIRSSLKKPQMNMDDSPCPNYDDFQLDLDKLKNEHEITVKWNTLPIETSRGCWWGQKKHCTFCGIDDITMRYRQRSVGNTLQILGTLRARHQSRFFRISDYILPHTYYSELLPFLASLEEEEKFVFTCEIKANIKSEQFRLLKEAGFIEVQPGIESFSSSVLKKMDKGVTAIQNILCVLLGHRHAVQVNYNLIYGFPDDDPKDYKEMAKTIPLLYHLNPPSSRIKVAVTRFAPLHTDPARFNFDPVYRHHPGYNVLFSNEFMEKTGFRLERYCYYFESPYKNSDELEYLYRMLDFQVDHWRSIHQKRSVYLVYEEQEDGIVFTDTRYDDDPVVKSYPAAYKEVYALCAVNLITGEEIRASLPHFDAGQVRKILDDLVGDRFLFREGTRYLGLALTEDCYENIKLESNKWSKPYV